MGAAVSTPGSTRLAYVYYRRVRAEAERHAASISQVLACAIAHEIGHLLMPEAGHSPAGLMRALATRRLRARQPGTDAVLGGPDRADRGALRAVTRSALSFRRPVRVSC